MSTNEHHNYEEKRSVLNKLSWVPSFCSITLQICTCFVWSVRKARKGENINLFQMHFYCEQNTQQISSAVRYFSLCCEKNYAIGNGKKEHIKILWCASRWYRKFIFKYHVSDDGDQRTLVEKFYFSFRSVKS